MTPLRSPRTRALAVLGSGVLIVSFASIFIRWAQAAGVDSIAIAAWRLGIAALVLVPIALVRERVALAPRDWMLALAAGAFLALHFGAWIVSLEHTTVAASTALVTTNPIWIAIGSYLVFRERLGGMLLVAITLALAGSALIFLADTIGEDALGSAFGNALAIVGSLAMCGYLMIGRGLRARIALLPYVAIVYTVAAAFLFGYALATKVPLAGFPLEGWGLLVLLALGPQIAGHGALNYALKALPATIIALAILGEPIGSTILAWLLLGETIGVIEIAGIAVLLVGIWLATRARV